MTVQIATCYNSLDLSVTFTYVCLRIFTETLEYNAEC